MAYQLGIDLGTTFSAAAVARDGRVEVVNLGTRNAQIPSVVLVEADGGIVVGDAAESRAVSEPTRVAREFKRRLGDPTPLFLGGAPFGAETLTAALLRAIAERVTQRMGSEPDAVVITYPAAYTEYRLDLLRDAARQAGLQRVTLVPEPVAAAMHYAATADVAVGTVIAVYDFGGGTFDTALLRRTPAGFEIVGEPQGLERLGGVDFDLAVLEHVNEKLGGQLSELDAADPVVLAQLNRIRVDARSAKEALSEASVAGVPVMLPGINREISISRGELENMVRPRLAETVRALERAARTAGLTIADISRVLLVGGSSRIPLIRSLVAQTTQRPVTADIDPEFAVALGAATLAAGGARPTAAPAATPTVATVPPPPAAPAAPPAPPPPAPTGPQPFVPSAQPAAGKPSGRRNALIGAGIAAVLVVAAVIVFATRGGDKKASPDTTGGSSPVATTPDTTSSDSTPTSESVPTTGTTPTGTTPVAPPAADNLLSEPATAYWAGFTVINNSLKFGPAGAGVVWNSSWQNNSPTPGDPANPALLLAVGGHEFTGALDSDPTINPSDQAQLVARFDAVPDGTDLSGAVITIGSTSQRTAQIRFDGGISGPVARVDAPLSYSIDISDGSTFSIDGAVIDPAGCVASDTDPTKLVLTPTAPGTGSVVVHGSTHGATGTSLTIDTITLDVPDHGSTTAEVAVPLVADTDTEFQTCFSVQMADDGGMPAGTYKITVSVSDGSTASADAALGSIVGDPCATLPADTITSSIGAASADVPSAHGEHYDVPFSLPTRSCEWTVIDDKGGPTSFYMVDSLNGGSTDAYNEVEGTIGSSGKAATVAGATNAFTFDRDGYINIIVQTPTHLFELAGADTLVTAEEITALAAQVVATQ